jgi:hypothetical protein
MDRRPFGRTQAGECVELFTLSGRIEASITTYGAAAQALLAPDRNGRRVNVALGFPTLDGYAGSNGLEPLTPSLPSSQATGGSRWQRISLVSTVDGPQRFAADCHWLQPRGSIEAPLSPQPAGARL